MNIKKESVNHFGKLFFALYLLVLIWVILFKLQFSVKDIQRIRDINLAPFYYDNGTGKTFHIKEVIGNFLLFVPFGIYISMPEKKLNFAVRLLIMAAASLCLEICQYALSIGVTDITDIISNAFGGIAGMAFYSRFVKMLKSKKRADTAIIIMAAVVTAEVIGFALLLISSYFA